MLVTSSDCHDGDLSSCSDCDADLGYPSTHFIGCSHLPESEMHCDHVENRWDIAVQRLVRRVERDHDGRGTVTGYSFLTEPHTEADCPFREADEIPMIVEPLGAAGLEGLMQPHPDGSLRWREEPVVNVSASAPDVPIPPAVYLEAVCPNCDGRAIRMLPNGERIEVICTNGHKFRTTNEKAWWDE